jgi:HAE1 family hydrophobic/amphiphilic exporter-1
MQWLAQVCVKRPVFTWVLMLSLIVIGFASLSGLGVDRFPKIEFPFVVITTILPGASPEQVESEVTDKIEESVNSISGLEILQSNSYESLSVVICQFELEKDGAEAAQEVRDRVNQILSELPAGAEQPRVLRNDPDAAPVMLVALTSNRSMRETTEYASRRLRRRIESLSGVGGITVLGGRDRIIEVVIDPSRLQSFGLTAAAVQMALATQNVDIPGGEVQQGPRTLNLRVQGKLQSIDDFKNIALMQRGGRTVLLGDVAQIRDTEDTAESSAVVSGENVVILSIRKQSGSNTVAVIDGLRERIDEVSATLPPGFSIRIVRDESEFIRNAIAAVEEHLILGSIFAALVVLLFLWNGRTTLIAALAIPTSIIATFAFVKAAGLTLNTITLLGLTLAVGIVIDDAIVVLENIFRFIEEKGYAPRRAAILATKEIGLAVLATTLSLVAVFLPVAFMGGIVGRFMNSFGLVMSFSIMVSLFVSFTLTPMLSARWIKGAAKPKHGAKGESPYRGLPDDPEVAARKAADDVDDSEWVDPAPGDRKEEQAAYREWRKGTREQPDGHHAEHTGGVYGAVQGFYMRVLAIVMERRWIVGILMVVTLGSFVPLVGIAQKNFLPLEDESRFDVNIRAPEGTSLQETSLISERIARQVRGLPGVLGTVTTTGAPAGDVSQRGPNQTQIFVTLVPPDQRALDQQAIMGQVRERILPAFEGANLRVAVSPVNVFGGSSEDAAPIQYILSGPDLDKLADYATRMLDRVKQIPGVVDADSTLVVGKPEYVVRVDRARAADLGVNIYDLAITLNMLVGGIDVSTFSEGGEQYDVRIRANEDARIDPDRIAQVTVPATGGRSVRLADIVSITEESGPSRISHFGRQRQVKIYCNVVPGTSEQTVISAIEAIKTDLNMEAGFRGELTGRSKELAKAGKSFLFAFVLSLVFMYLVLAAQFESWIHPITIIISLPLTLPFAVLSIVVMNQSLNIFSALGILVLFGIVKKNSILQVDHMRALRRKGLDRADAVMIGNRDRLRPILMTTIAFVAGMVPLVFSSGAGAGTNRAMGTVIMGGQTLSLALTLLATPVVFTWFDDVSHSRFMKRVGKGFALLISPFDKLFTSKADGAKHEEDVVELEPEPTTVAEAE